PLIEGIPRLLHSNHLPVAVRLALRSPRNCSTNVDSSSQREFFREGSVCYSEAGLHQTAANDRPRGPHHEMWLAANPSYPSEPIRAVPSLGLGFQEWLCAGQCRANLRILPAGSK